jgi:hypothetical protein
MKIAEILGSDADREEADISLLQTIANAFTQTGKVKRPLNQQPSVGQPLAGNLSRGAFEEAGIPAVKSLGAEGPDRMR